MDNLLDSVDQGTSKCLICNHDVVLENSLLIKTEIEESYQEYVQTNLGPGISKAGSSSPEGHLNFLDTFCKLLKLTSQNKAMLCRSQFYKENSILFCADCCLIISDAVKLFEQIQILQNNVEKIGVRVGSILNQTYLNHVNNIGHTNDNCKAGKCCSKLDRWRGIIVNDLQARSTKKHLTSTKSSTLLAEEDFNCLFGEYLGKAQLKELSVTLNRLSQDEIDKHLHRPNSEIAISLDSVDTGCEFDPVEIDDGPQYEDNEDYLTEEEFHASIPIVPELDKRKPDEDKPKPVRKKLPTEGRNYPGPGRYNKNAECPECHETFRNIYLMNSHIVRSHKVDVTASLPFNCGQCGKIYSTDVQLKRHLQRQEGVCKKPKLPEHCKIVTGYGEKKFECILCAYRESSKARFIRHLGTHTTTTVRFMCDVCGVSLKEKRSLRQHKLLKHFNGNLEDHPFKCKFPSCDKYFGGREALKNHEKLFHGVGEFNFPCLQCDFKGMSAAHLNRHHKYKHTNFRPYKCEICNKAYKQSEVLKRHNLQYHTAPEDRPYKCTVCGKGFAARYRLSNHEAVHTNDNHVLCTICGKSFAIKVYLGIHMKIHEKKGEIPLKGGKVKAVSEESETERVDVNLNE